VRIRPRSVAALAADAAAEVVRRRVEALGVGTSEVTLDGTEITVRVPGGDEGRVRRGLERPGRLEFRPVLDAHPGDDVAEAPPEERDDGAQVVLPARDADGSPRYRLGPVALTSSAIESATAERSAAGVSTVNPVLRDGAAGIGRFNQVARSCFAAEAACPEAEGLGAGQLAVVVDGEIAVRD
jgi:preprotein translocase subunit SecD